MTLIAMMTMARSYGCIVMAGDGNATTLRLYNASRVDQKGGVQPGFNNSSIQVVANIFQEACNTDKPMAHRMQVHAIPAFNSYELCSKQMKEWMENGCTRLSEESNDTMLIVIFDIARYHAHLEQRQAQSDYIIKFHRMNVGNCRPDGSDLPSDVTPATNWKSHTSEACMHTDSRDHFTKDVPSSNAQWLSLKNGKLCSRMSAQVHVPLAMILTAIERSEKGENKTMGLAHESKGQQERKTFTKQGQQIQTR